MPPSTAGRRRDDVGTTMGYVNVDPLKATQLTPPDDDGASLPKRGRRPQERQNKTKKPGGTGLSWSGRRDSNPGDPTEKHEETSDVLAHDDAPIGAFDGDSTADNDAQAPASDPTESDEIRPPQPNRAEASEVVAVRLAAALERATAAEQWRLAERLMTALERLTEGLEPLAVARGDAPSEAGGVDGKGARVIRLLPSG